jgi:hypothetical protein
MAEKSEDQAIQTCKKVLNAVPEFFAIWNQKNLCTSLLHTLQSLLHGYTKLRQFSKSQISLNLNTFTTRPVSDVLLES